MEAINITISRDGKSVTLKSADILEVTRSTSSGNELTNHWQLHFDDDEVVKAKDQLDAVLGQTPVVSQCEVRYTYAGQVFESVGFFHRMEIDDLLIDVT